MQTSEKLRNYAVL